jgi:hypothetical protein
VPFSAALSANGTDARNLRRPGACESPTHQAAKYILSSASGNRIEHPLSLEGVLEVWLHLLSAATAFTKSAIVCNHGNVSVRRSTLIPFKNFYPILLRQAEKSSASGLSILTSDF